MLCNELSINITGEIEECEHRKSKFSLHQRHWLVSLLGLNSITTSAMVSIAMLLAISTLFALAIKVGIHPCFAKKKHNGLQSDDLGRSKNVVTIKKSRWRDRGTQLLRTCKVSFLRTRDRPVWESKLAEPKSEALTSTSQRLPSRN